jgi:tetratricopeptide (TPR) repeat protein
LLLALVLSPTAHAQRRRPPPTPPPVAETPPPAAPTQQEQDDALARNHFESGRAYFAQARYDDAAREFSEAYRLSHRNPLLLNLARALEEADRETEAVEALDIWLRDSPPNDPSRTEVTERRTRLVHEAELRAAANQTQTTPPPTETASSGGSRAMFFAGIAAMGVGAASGAIAIGTGVAAHGIHGDLEALCGPSGTCPASADDDIAHGQRLARASTAMTFIGIAAAGAGVVLVILGRDTSDDEEPAVAFSPWVLPNGGGAELRLSF